MREREFESARLPNFSISSLHQLLLYYAATSLFGERNNGYSQWWWQRSDAWYVFWSIQQNTITEKHARSARWNQSIAKQPQSLIRYLPFWHQQKSSSSCLTIDILKLIFFSKSHKIHHPHHCIHHDHHHGGTKQGKENDQRQGWH